MITRYNTVGELALAIQSGEVPVNVISPGLAAEALGVTRQAVWDRIKRGKLRAWAAEGTTLIDVSSGPFLKKALARSKAGR